MSVLKMSVRTERNFPILEVDGIYNEVTRPAFKSELDPLVAKHKYLIVDINNLKAITAKGIGVLLETSKHLKKQGGALVLVCDVSKKRRIVDLDLYRFTCDVFDTQEQALDHLEHNSSLEQ